MRSVQFVLFAIGDKIGSTTNSFAPDMYTCGSAKKVARTDATANDPLFFQIKSIAPSPYLRITGSNSALRFVAVSTPSSESMLNL